MVWLLLIVILVLILGLGTVLEAALWLLVVLAVLALAGAFLVSRALGR